MVIVTVPVLVSPASAGNEGIKTNVMAKTTLAIRPLIFSPH
jgi:hypothetical protein